MSGNSGNLNASEENNKLEPDFFGLYVREAEELLSLDEALLPSSHQATHLVESFHEMGRGKGQTNKNCRTNEKSGIVDSTSLFSDGLGAQLSEFKMERLKALLWQSVFSFTPEVDEITNPVLSVCRIRSCLRYKEALLRKNDSAHKDDPLQHPQKKRKESPICPETKFSDNIVGKSTPCHSTGPSSLNPTPEDVVKDDEDLQFILENDASKVEELLNKHSGDLSDTLNHMEQKLEELLNITMTTCRQMTITEKQHLRKLIQSLPSTNLDRVVDIIERNKSSEKPSSDEVYVDLDQQDNVTLWRLYFYVKMFQARTGTKTDQGK